MVSSLKEGVLINWSSVCSVMLGTPAMGVNCSSLNENVLPDRKLVCPIVFGAPAGEGNDELEDPVPSPKEKARSISHCLAGSSFDDVGKRGVPLGPSLMKRGVPAAW